MQTVGRAGSFLYSQRMSFCELFCMGYNAGGGLSSLDDLRAVLVSLELSHPVWSFLFISEVDGKLAHSENESSFRLDGHLAFRHWPGPGSCPMMIVINHAIAHLYRDIVWNGRAGGIRLFSHGSLSAPCMNLTIVGLHGGHGDELLPSLADASTVIRTLQRGNSFNAQVFAVADFNVDLLPSFSYDPFAHVTGREAHHLDRRIALQDWTDTFGLELFPPECVIGNPGGAWDSDAIVCPITRIPIGDQSGLPSCLDYAVASPGLISASACDWTYSFSDHALVVYRLTPKLPRFRRVQRAWHVIDESACIDQLKEMPFHSADSIGDVCEKLMVAQNVHESQLTCRQRRLIRMPFELRQFYRNAANSTCEADRRMWQLRAKTRRKTWAAEMRTAARIKAVRSGRVLQKSKKLHPIHSVVCDGERTSDLDTCSAKIADFFAAKWGCRNLHIRSEVSDLLSLYNDCKVLWTLEEVSMAFRKLGKRCRRNFDGLCVRIMEYLFIAQPLTFTEWMSTVLASCASMNEVELGASAFGKLSSATTLQDVRVIVPLTAFLQITDVLLATRLESFLQQLWPVNPLLMECARPHTQVMDIVFAASIFVEKDLDLLSHGAFAQADVRQHYDSLSLLRIFSLVGFLRM